MRFNSRRAGSGLSDAPWIRNGRSLWSRVRPRGCSRARCIRLFGAWNGDRDQTFQFPGILATPCRRTHQAPPVMDRRRALARREAQSRIPRGSWISGGPRPHRLAADRAAAGLCGYRTVPGCSGTLRVSQVTALRWLVRQCLRNPAGSCSVHRLTQDLKSQGHCIARDTVNAMLGHLTDAFLLSTVPIATDSERQRNSNPREIYPVDPGLDCGLRYQRARESRTLAGDGCLERA